VGELIPPPRHSGEGRNPALLGAVSPTLDPGLRRGDEEARRGGEDNGSSAAVAELSSVALQKLMAWLSPAFPVGAYTYSHGLEWAIEDGTVTNAATLMAWIGDVLAHGGGRNDGIFFVAAYAREGAALRELADLGAAFQPSRERHLETTAQGRAFLKAVTAAWPNARLSEAEAALAGTDVPYPVAVAVAAAAHDVPLLPALTTTLSAFVANIVSAGVRAIPIGQSDGQRTIAALMPAVAAAAEAALTFTLDDLGGAALRADIASMKHETQYTRLFRS
jgi:urease accessory protein